VGGGEGGGQWTEMKDRRGRDTGGRWFELIDAFCIGTNASM
jgi:hypothetical protein